MTRPPPPPLIGTSGSATEKLASEGRREEGRKEGRVRVRVPFFLLNPSRGFLAIASLEFALFLPEGVWAKAKFRVTCGLYLDVLRGFFEFLIFHFV